MPLQATSGAASYDAFGGGVPVVPNYIEDVFSTYLYTGTGATNNIVNGIDLAGKGGLVWTKARSTTTASTFAHALIDTLRGVGVQICSDRTDENYTQANSLTAFNTNGYTLGTDSGGQGRVNNTSYGTQTYVSWTFRKQPKFFDVVTYTGNDVQNRAVPHNLGSVPGCIIIKQTNSAGQNWHVWHRSLNPAWTGGTTSGNVSGSNDTGAIYLNTTDSFNASVGTFTYQTSTAFGVYRSNLELNNGGSTYVAYLFAHNAGGFGLTGTDNVISCGSFTTDGSGDASVTLGYEPQWVMWKAASGSYPVNSWMLNDTMRGFSQTNTQLLRANTAAAEFSTGASWFKPNATGFSTQSTNALSPSTTFIYIAIRRGPMKVPTVGTSVFSPVAYSGNGAAEVNVTSAVNAPSFSLTQQRNRAGWTNSVYDRLRGNNRRLITDRTDAESGANGVFLQNGITLAATDDNNASGINYINYFFQRAPSFFDEVCYTGNGTFANRKHNLTVVPELAITKRRSGVSQWIVIYPITSTTGNYLTLETTSAASGWGDTGFSATEFGVPDDVSGQTYVTYLFATAAGVSKVGSYTGTGALQTVNCGFTSGARFVLIKRTDSTGDWWTYDSARGITSGNDPYLYLNSTAAEVTGTNYVDTDSTGFKVTAAAPAGLNASGGTYIFLAIA